MHLYLPRRHRRKLLLPPGLLALTGLLWLGSVAIRSWREKLRRKAVVQLTMPPRPDSDTIFHTSSFSNPLRIPFLYSQLYKLYKWREVEFNGNAAHDSLSALLISQNIQAMRADTIPNCGIRVVFTSKVSYKGWVKLIDLMTLNDQKKYLFDMYHGPLTLYVLVDEYSPQAARTDEPQMFCGTMATMPPANYKFTPVGYWSVSYFTRIGHWLAALWKPEVKNTSWYTSAIGTGTEYDITLTLEKQYLPHFLRSIPRQIFTLSCSEWGVQFLLIIGMSAISWRKLKRQLQPS
ncbi:hypothetical protein [Hymenobacter rubidus]|uniref:hypothetical protein n=1 Tax=Hymenobacter rubidus TaxID=1441626 RepID=UPI00191D2391|nr:hypothetical protein [Hymenobacter rubidus]